MAIPTYDSTIVQQAVGNLIAPFQTPNTQALLSSLASEQQQFENAIVGPTGYLYLIQIANALTDTLNKYGQIVNWPRGALSDNEYRVFIYVKIAADSSDSTGDALLNILSLAATGVSNAGPFAVHDWDNWGFNAAVDIQAGYTPYPNALATLLPIARGGGIYATLRVWNWIPAGAPNPTTNLGLLVPGWKTGTLDVANATGMKDLISGTYNNASPWVAQV